VRRNKKIVKSGLDKGGRYLVYGQYRFLQTEHSTTLTNGAIQSEVLYEKIHNTTIGIRYYF